MLNLSPKGPPTREPCRPRQLRRQSLNALLSTGPKTPEGKLRSSINSTRHGLTGRTVVLPNEDHDLYRTFAAEIVESLQPETPIERQLAQTVADTQWRLNRLRSIEEGMFALTTHEASYIELEDAL